MKKTSDTLENGITAVAMQQRPHDELDDAILAEIPAPTRVMAPVKWYGGKGNMAKNIVPLIASTKVYVEPFCGAASLLWHLSPRPVEVLNDLDGELVNFFRVMADDESFPKLRHRLIWTLYSLDEFRRALSMPKDASQIDRAWAFYVRHNQGFSGLAKTEGRWGRAFTSACGMADTANSWRKRLTQLTHWHQRLSRCQIDSRDAIECVEYWDSDDTCFYVDPPYVHDTRTTGNNKEYAVEPDNDFHERLIALLIKVKGQVVLSGYNNPIYEKLVAAGWDKKEIQTACYAASRSRGTKLRGQGALLEHAARIECIWTNRQRQMKLF